MYYTTMLNEEVSIMNYEAAFNWRLSACKDPLIEKEKVGSVALKKRHKNVTFLSRLQRTYFLLLTAFTFMPYGNFG
jgi:hypothetical protein